ncbi:unnamed protein product [Haemonchus placei]|uniref:NAD(P)-binding protein n=1 Tax=Haemonchus placei TaxID=6290 RepID=A0A0N4X257_HAEPC|nr:unnamed protein product [Haemonchus placei]
MGRVRGVVLITGANRGVGYELTRTLLLNDAITRVYTGCRNSERAERLQSLHDPHKKLRIVELDVSKDWSIKSAVAAIVQESGHINLLINNAAILEKDHKAGIPDGERAAWLRHFDINVVSPAMVIQECLPLLRKSISKGETATIVNISGRKGSIELCPGTESVHGNYAYMCSKTAINHLTRLMSIEHPDLLTVAMCPGWNRTDMGGPNGKKDPSETAPRLLSTVNGMTIEEHSGKFWDRKGRPIPY